jgi:uncharacterized membrane protein YdjX (TVP38/TMEM64 family)
MVSKIKKRYKRFLIFSLLIVILFLFYLSYNSEGILYDLINQDIDSIIGFFNSLGFFAEIIFVLLIILEVVLAPLPPLALYIAGGVLFGAFFGGILTLFGNIIGAGIDFFVARKYARGLVEKKVDEKLRNKFDNFSSKYGGFAIFLLRVNPLTTTDLVSYLSGLSKIKFKTFLIWTTAGLMPLIFIQTYFGDFFVKENKILFTLTIIISLIYVLIIIYFLINMFFKRSKNINST